MTVNPFWNVKQVFILIYFVVCIYMTLYDCYGLQFLLQNVAIVNVAKRSQQADTQISIVFLLCVIIISVIVHV